MSEQKDAKSLNAFMKNWESKNKKTNIQSKRGSTTQGKKAEIIQVVNNSNNNNIRFDQTKIAIFLQNLLRMQRVRVQYKKKRRDQEYRKRVAEELLSTEKTYVSVLTALVNLFLRPIEEKEILPVDAIREIFSNVEIIQKVNSTLYVDLSDRITNWSNNQIIGDVFIRLSDFFKVYIDYVKNYNVSVNRIIECKKDESFAKFLKVQMLKVEKYEHDELQSLLITPVQRIPRYNLLITDLLKRTPPEHPDYNNLQIAQEKLKSTATYVNSRAKQAEDLTKIYSIQNSISGKFDSFLDRDRRLLREGSAKQYTPSKKKKTPIYIILFNDILVCCKNEQKKFSRNTTKFEFLLQISLSSAFLVQYPDDPSFGNVNCFSIETRKEKCYISCDTEEEKQNWIADINKQILETNEKFTFYEAKKDEVASHKAEEARAIIGEKYTQMRVRGTNSPSETPDVTTSPSVSGQRRFASLRKTTISPHQKLENIEIAKQATENLLKEEQQNIEIKQQEAEKKAKDFKDQTAQKYKSATLNTSTVNAFKEQKEFERQSSYEEKKTEKPTAEHKSSPSSEKRDSKMKSWSLKKKFKEDYKEKFKEEFNFNDFEDEFKEKPLTKQRSNSNAVPVAQNSPSYRTGSKKSNDDSDINQDGQPQLRSWAMKTRNSYTPRK